MSREAAVLASFVSGAVFTCVVWMATYWAEAAERQQELEQCDAERSALIEAVGK